MPPADDYSNREPVPSPPRALLALEGRAILEVPALLAAAPFLASAPRGDGHPVVVLPGFGADDRSTVVIRRYLRHLGYDAHGWNRGRNVRAPYVDLPDIVEQARRLARTHDTPVSLVGWSRGGILAREVARQIPGQARMVLTLASPFAAPGASNMSLIWRAFNRGASVPMPSPELMRRIARPIPVPSTSIYTRFDGVVAWQRCVETPGPERENVEVNSSHSGIGFHPPALWVIADRLAQPPGEWQPFQPGPYIAHFFPRSARTSGAQAT